MALVWHGNEAMRTLLADARRKVREAVILVERDVKASMRLGGRVESGEMETITVTGRGGRDVRRRVEVGTGKRAEKINSYRSKPGEVPRVQTGTLRRSITHELHETLPIGRVGTNVVYGKYLCFGTRRMKPRPFMRPSLLRTLAAITAIFGKPVAGGMGHS